MITGSIQSIIEFMQLICESRLIYSLRFSPSLGLSRFGGVSLRQSIEQRLIKLSVFIAISWRPYELIDTKVH